jgi:hypothetical protein
MIELPKRQFTAKKGERQEVPLWIGLYGPSGGGKTYTALALAEGIRSVQGGPIYCIDTEAKRALHYADKFDFIHVPFEPPYGSLDYLAAIQFALKDNTSGKRPTIIIDSMSHEHEGAGGMMELQDQIATRMATVNGQFDAKKYERVKMLAWGEPKGKRRALINGMLNIEANFILCFRAKDSSAPVQTKQTGNNGQTFMKTEVVHKGFVPIGGDDFIYECTLATLLLPGAKGVPTWKSDLVGEKQMIKLPEQFLSLEEIKDRPLNQEIGANLAKWAIGSGAKPTPAAKPDKPKEDAPPPKTETTKSRVAAWVDWLEGEMKSASSEEDVRQIEDETLDTMSKLEKADPALHKRARAAIDARLIEIDAERD